MKKYFFVIFAFIATGSGVFAQSNNNQIAAIDKTKEEIKSNLANFQLIDSGKTASGSVFAYSKDKQLQFVTINVLDKEQHITKHIEWYFLGGHLIYSEQLWTNSSTGEVINNEKFYVSDSHLIDWIKTGKDHVDPAADAFKKMAEMILAYGEKQEVKYASKLK